MKAAVLFTLGLASAAPLLETRASTTYQTVLTDIANLAAKLATTTTQIQSFQPNNIFVALEVLGSSFSLESAISQTTTDVQNSAPFGKTGSNKIATAVLNLEKPIYAALDALIGQQANFHSGIFGIPLDGIVEYTLNTLKSETDKLGAAIIPKLTPSLQKVAPTIISQIDAHFEQAIQVYST